MYGPTGDRAATRSLMSVVMAPWVGFRGMQWRFSVLAFAALNAVALAPMLWFDELDVPLPTLFGMFAALPIVAYLQPWIGVVSVLRVMRASQLVMLPLLVLFGALSLPLAVFEHPNTARAVASGVAVLAALGSLIGQVRLWRRQARDLTVSPELPT